MSRQTRRFFWLLCLLTVCFSCGKSEQEIRAEKEARNEALFRAAAGGRAQEVRTLLQDGADVRSADAAGTTALMKAADSGNPDAVRELIQGGANVNAADKKGNTVLMHAVVDTVKPSGVSADRKNVVQELIRGGSDVSAVDKEGRTPLMQAAAWGNAELVRELVKARADVNAATPDGMTALMTAANQPKSVNDTTGIVEFLLEAGADPNAETKDGKTALNLAERHSTNPEVVRILREATEQEQTSSVPDDSGKREDEEIGGLFSVPQQILKGLEESDAAKQIEQLARTWPLPSSELDKVDLSCWLKKTSSFQAVACTVSNKSSWVIDRIAVEFRGTTAQGVSLVRSYTLGKPEGIKPGESFSQSQDSGFDVDFAVVSFSIAGAFGRAGR